MTGNQHSASNQSEHCTNDNAPEHEASEPKLIAEQHRRAPSGPKHLDADPLTGGPPPSSPNSLPIRCHRSSHNIPLTRWTL